MGRVREFSEDEVLDRAMSVFWRQGFEASSIDDLVAASGINRGSMYAAFGDKRGLFLAVLDRYLSHVNSHRAALLTADRPALDCLRAFFDSLVGSGAERSLGCLVTNTLTEVAPSDPEIAKKLSASLTKIEGLFAATIRRGQREGDIRRDRDARALARLLLGVAQGMRVLARAGAAPDMLRDIAGQTIATLN